jgi:hypothetical protein
MRQRSPLPLGVDDNDIGDSSTSRHVYVHHINEQQQQQQAAPQYAPPPQPQYYPQPPQVMPMPIPFPQPMPMPMYGGCGHGGGYNHYQPPPQPPVIVVNGGGGNNSGGGGGGGDAEKAAKKDDDGAGGGDSGGGGGGGTTKKFSAVMLASTIFTIIGSILGFICVGKVYDVFEHSIDNNNNNNNESDYFMINRTVALSVGAAAILLFWISFMLAFYAGMKYKIKHGKGNKDGKCCRDGLLIAGLVLFGLTFMNNLIILVLAFDDGARIYPEAVLSAVFGSIAAWLCVFGWAELVRRS